MYAVRTLPDTGLLIRLHKRTGCYYRPDRVYVVVNLLEGRNLGPDNCWKTASGRVHRAFKTAQDECEGYNKILYARYREEK